MIQFQSVSEVFAAVRRRFWVIALVTIVGCVLSLNYALNLTKVYEATAVVQIEDARVPDSLAGATAQAEDAARRVRLIEQRLMSRDNVLAIMNKHDLFSDDPEMSLNERVFLMREATQITAIINPAQRWQPGAAPSGVLITARLNDPDKAAALANELMLSIITQSRERSATQARDTLLFFEQEETRVEAEIAGLENRIAAFKRTNADALPDGIDAMRNQLALLQETDLELDQQILTLEGNATRAREDVLDRQIALLNERKTLIAERIAEIEGNMLDAPSVERDLSAMERQLTQLQEQYGVIARRKAEAELGQMLDNRQQRDRFEVLETALPPENSVSRSPKKVAMLGGVMSLFAGIGVALVLELMNPAIRTVAQMERALGMQPVIAVPVITTRRDNLYGGMKRFAFLATGLAALGAIYAAMADKLPSSAFLERFLPRLARG